MPRISLELDRERTPSQPTTGDKLVARELAAEHLADNLKRDTIVLAKAHWCPHCTDYVPVFQSLAPQLPYSTAIVEVGDARAGDAMQRNLLQKYGISGFPSLLLLKANGEGKVVPAMRNREALQSEAAQFFANRKL